MLMRRRGYRPGDFLRTDDRTGFTVWASETRKEWTGAIVHRDVYEARHPQDYVRARVDRQSVPDPRPEPDPVFVPATGPAMFLVQSDGVSNKSWDTTDPDAFDVGGDGDSEFTVYRSHRIDPADYPQSY